MPSLAADTSPPTRRELAFGLSVLFQAALPLAYASAAAGLLRGWLFVDFGSNTALLSSIAQGLIASLYIVTLPWLALLAAYLMSRKAAPPAFYLSVATPLAWLWLPFFPLGTLFGILHLRQLGRWRG